MKCLQRLLAVLFVIASITVKAQVSQDAKPITIGSDSYRMKTFIDALMNKMTLDEKIGQLNLPGAGDITTGQAGNSEIGKKIREGKVGGLFNIKSVAKIRDVQKVAVEAKPLKNSNDLRNGRDPWISNRFSNSACIIMQLGYAKNRTKRQDRCHRSEC